MRTLKKVLAKDKKQQGFRIRNSLVTFLNSYVEELNKRGELVSKNDVIESLLYELKEKGLENANKSEK